MNKTATVGLLCCGTFLIGISQVDHPSIKPFAQAAAYVGGALLAFAKTDGLFAPRAITPSTGDDKANK